ncbi:MAG: hypothetical protein OHK0024_35650 [Thalassobaculales bacterium]
MRQALLIGLPLLLPTLVYALWFWAATARAPTPEAAPRLGDAPMVSLVATGLGLAMLALAAAVLFDGAPAGSTYVPPHMDNGRLVPGQSLPR